MLKIIKKLKLKKAYKRFLAEENEFYLWSVNQTTACLYINRSEKQSFADVCNKAGNIETDLHRNRIEKWKKEHNYYAFFPKKAKK